jgi:hypothetical protein
LQPLAGGFAAAQGAAGWPGSEERSRIARLPTPERIDAQRALRQQRLSALHAALDRRGDAAKALYAALDPEQRRIFDEKTAAMVRQAPPPMRGGRAQHGLAEGARGY